MQMSFDNRLILEEQYEKYLRNPADVLPSWRGYFKEQVDRAAIAVASTPTVAAPGRDKEAVCALIRAYRTFGHLMARTDPLALEEPKEPEELKLETFGLSSTDLPRRVPAMGLLPQGEVPLSDLLQFLRKIYCGSMGVEYMGVHSRELDSWMQEHLEQHYYRQELSLEQKYAILQQLNRSELFELFLHKNYTGQKRFSLEGGETLIPMLNAIIAKAAAEGAEEFMIGMAHRGRLNVLCNVLDKSYGEIFSEFNDHYVPESVEGSGDVKYHKGFASAVLTASGHKVQVLLAPNASHLESVYPVVEGQARARQVKLGDQEALHRVIPIAIHGDAALAGQGVDYETLQMYRLFGYSNGGTLHLVINNQIGFTTLPHEGRSTRYCTDIARCFGAPVFHVNAEDPIACVYAALLAVELRSKFHTDVFIDLVGYRKFGHNEADEPAYTQPLQYQIIRKKRPIRELYLAQLIAEGVMDKQAAEKLEKEFEQALHEAKQTLPTRNGKAAASREGEAEPLSSVATGVPLEELTAIAESFSLVPPGFNVNPKLQHILQARLAMVRGETPLDWATAEQLAFGSLLWQGAHVRLAGQDSRRGTFSQRHALWVDQNTEEERFPLAHLKPDQGRFDVINSLLSEFGAVAFEYGYSVGNPEALVLWEAQFGDFCNGAQVVIDQYLTTAEQKWGIRSSLVLLLPHGYEGQGPEHSSARMERFLTLCAEDNLRVVYPSTPAQLFHLLRRQWLSLPRKPLIVFTPKGLLRHPNCVSRREQLSEGRFYELLDDSEAVQKPRRALFCTGHLYFDLMAARREKKAKEIAILRIEQLYPFPSEGLKMMIANYSSVKEWFWVQEEPQNMGAWRFLQPQLEPLLAPRSLSYIGRPESASTATGSHARHKREHEAIIKKVFS